MVHTHIYGAICCSECAKIKYCTALFRTNKTISDESTHFFYSHCNFYASDLPSCKSFRGPTSGRIDECWVMNLRTSLGELYSFLRSIGPCNRQSIRQLKITMSLEETFRGYAGTSGQNWGTGLQMVKSTSILSEAHDLRLLIFVFIKEKALAGFLDSKDLMQEMSKIRGVQKCHLFVPTWDLDDVKRKTVLDNITDPDMIDISFSDYSDEETKRYSSEEDYMRVQKMVNEI